MTGKRAAGGVLVLLVLVAIVAALVLVLGQPPETPSLVEEDPPVATVDAGADDPGRTRTRARPAGAARLYGRVVRGHEDAPASGVSVRLDSEFAGARTATTGLDGAFAFEAVAPGGPYTVSVTEDGSADVRVPGIALDRNEERDVGDLRLAPAVPVTVDVRTMDGVPLPGATVEAYAAPSVAWGDWSKRLAQMGVTPVAVAALTTDAAGRVRFDGLASGRWTFRARKPGYAARGVAGRNLASGRAADDVVIHLPRGWELTGTVRNGSGEPLPGVTVLAMDRNAAWSLDHGPLHGRAVSSAEGGYHLAGLRRGAVDLWAALPGGAPGRVFTVEIPRVGALDIELRMGGIVTGRVTLAADDSPVVGCTVRATAMRGGNAFAAEAATDADGVYAIETLLEGTLSQLTADLPGYVPQIAGAPWKQIPLVAGKTVTWDLSLRRAADVVGQVSGPDGPLPGAKLQFHLAHTNGQWTTRSATADADGRYRLEGVDRGRGLIRVTATGHFQPDYPQEYWTVLQQGKLPDRWGVEIPDEAGDVVKDLLLDRGVVVTGIVVDPDGEPVAGARVVVSAVSGASTTTGADGAFRLVGVPIGVDAPIVGSADGFRPKREELRFDQDHEGLEIRLEAEILVRGRVVSDSELVDAYVQIGTVKGGDGPRLGGGEHASQWVQRARVPVRLDGTFETAAPTWTPFTVRASALDHAASEVRAETGASTEVDVEIRLEPGGRLHGLVREADGVPLSGALVLAGPSLPTAPNEAWRRQQNPLPVVAVTAADGAFAIEHLPPLRHTVTVQMHGYVEATQTATPGGEAPLAFALKPALVIAGVVRFVDGTPVAGAHVSVLRKAAAPTPTNTVLATGDDGSFRQDGLAAGLYTVQVDPPWSGDVNVTTTVVEDVTAGAEDLVIEASRGLTITGRVVDDSGEGVGAVQLSGQPPQPAQPSTAPGGITRWRMSRTDDDGTFVMGGLHAGVWSLHIGAQNGFAGTVVAGVAAGARDVLVRIARGLEISGVLVNEQGEPLGSKQLLARPAANEEGVPVTWSSAQTQHDGSFTFSGLAPGDWQLQLQGSGGEVLNGGDSVAAGTTGLRLEVTTGLSIAGTVVTSDGGALTGTYVMALPRGQPGVGQQAAGVNADGAFSVSGLQPGVTYTLRTGGGSYRPTDVTEVEAGVEGVRIEVVPGLSVSGRLLLADGSAATGGYLSFEHVAGQNRGWVRIAAEGNFAVGGLVEGTYRVFAMLRKGPNDPSMSRTEVGSVEPPATGLELRLPSE